MHILLIKKDQLKELTISDLKEKILGYVSKYIGSKHPTGVSGLG